MQLFLMERYNIQKDLLKNCLDRSNSFLSGLSLFLVLVYLKVLVRWRSYKIENYWKDNYFDFNGIKISGRGKKNPNELRNFKFSYEDIFFPFIELKDKYDLKCTRNLDLILFEGPYFLEEDGVNVNVDVGDVILDCGAWIGDFSAYASFKGAKCYAFEPFSDAYSGLEETCELTGGSIIPVKLGLSNQAGVASLELNNLSSSVSKVTMNQTENVGFEKINLITIDDFVQKQNLSKVDFIKADIEGHERYMLMGAKETLNKFAPKLAICTYHLPDDPEVLSKIILEANPAYKVIQKKKKLFASVP